MYHHSIIAFILLLGTLNLAAQDWKEKGSDELFELARTEAFDGNREKARLMLQHILIGSPDYADVRILLGRTYAWDGMRDLARKEFQTVLDKDPTYQDALNALIDVQMWDDQYNPALVTVNRALKTYPNFEDFLYKKAKILNSLERNEEAMNTLDLLLLVNPSSEPGLLLQESIKTSRQRYTLSYRVGMDYFDRDFSKYAFSSAVQLGRSNSWGTSIARVNFARRFESNGIQGEIDLYPRIANGAYAYLNYGFSSSSLFPNHRIGVEIYKSLPKSFEASVGLRHLRFGGDPITIYTGSLGWYHRSMWFSLRPFITPDKRAGSSISAGLTVRRYFSNPNTYIGLNGAMGYSPDAGTIQSGTGINPNKDEIYTLKSQRFGMTVQKQLRYNLIASGDLDFARQEISYDVGNYLWITSVLLNLSYRF